MMTEAQILKEKIAHAANLLKRCKELEKKTKQLVPVLNKFKRRDESGKL